jgi:hypothetical protein
MSPASSAVPIALSVTLSISTTVPVPIPVTVPSTLVTVLVIVAAAGLAVVMVAPASSAAVIVATASPAVVIVATASPAVVPTTIAAAVTLAVVIRWACGQGPERKHGAQTGILGQLRLNDLDALNGAQTQHPDFRFAAAVGERARPIQLRTGDQGEEIHRGITNRTIRGIRHPHHKWLG